MGGPAGVVAESGNAIYKTLDNNVNERWTRDPGLRRLNIGILMMFASAAANGYDGSLINGLLAIPYCKLRQSRPISCVKLTGNTFKSTPT